MTETRAIVNDRAGRLGYTFSEVAAAVGITANTLRKKCEAPELLTGSDIKRMAQALKLNEEQKNEIVKEAIA